LTHRPGTNIAGVGSLTIPTEHLPLGLYALSNAMQYTGDWVGLMAGVVIIMVPTIILYVFLSEKMISGITMGAVK
jgi:ABC-type glycerol-3-phosphate transport system permease component